MTTFALNPWNGTNLSRCKAVTVQEGLHGSGTNLLKIFERSLRLLEGNILENPCKFEQSDRLQPGEAHIGHSIKYCEISLLIYSGNSNLSNLRSFELTRYNVRS